MNAQHTKPPLKRLIQQWWYIKKSDRIKSSFIAYWYQAIALEIPQAYEQKTR